MKHNDPALVKSDEQIDWVLSQANVSPWVKSALKTARDCDPVDVLNDLEVLNLLLRTRSNTWIQSAFEKREAPSQ